jgi:hypothetical protein
MRPFALIVFACSLPVVGAACASKGPPPRVAEVPIDDAPPGLRGPVPVVEGPATEPATADPTSALGAAAGALGGGGGGGGAAGLLPAMSSLGGGGGAGGAGSAPAAGSSAKPLPPKGERLSAVECNKVMDKYIELVGVSQGISPDAIGGVMSMLRNSVANDPNYGNALGACARENTKTQYRCAMGAKDVDTWNKCLK